MSSKARKLGTSSAFGSATQATSARRQLIAEATGEAPMDPTRVPLEQMVGNPENPRESLGDVQELANSLQQHGLRQPVSVMPSRDFVRLYPEHEAAVGSATFVVVNGNRRLAAAQEAGLATLAVYVTELADGASVRIAALVENIHRQDLAPLEEAAAVQELVGIYGSNAEVARHLAKTRAWVGQRLALLGLAPELQQALRTGELKIKDARRLGTLPPEEQHAEWERVVNPVYDLPADPKPTSSPSDAPEVANRLYDQAQDQADPPANNDQVSSHESGPASSAEGVDLRNSEKAAQSPPDSAEQGEEQPVQLMLELEWYGEAKTLAQQIYERLQVSLGAESRDAVLDELQACR